MSYRHIIFSAPALLDGQFPAYRADEALAWLRARDVSVSVIGYADDGAWKDKLTRTGMDGFFQGNVHEGTNVTSITEMSSYWDAIKASGIEARETMAIVSDVESVRRARNGGVGKIIGYAGNLKVKFDSVAPHEESLSRVGAHHTINNYAQLPDLYTNIKPLAHPQWHPIKQAK